MEYKLLIYRLTVIIAVFVSCNTASYNHPEEEKSTAIKVDNSTATKLKKDTTSFKYFIKLTENYVDIPSYLVKKFIEPGLSHDPYGSYAGDGSRHNKLNEIIIVSYIHSVAGVCGYGFLKSFNLNGNPISTLKVGNYCDHDFSFPQYTYSDYKILSDSIIEITSSTETAETISDTIQDYHNSKFITSEKFQYYLINQFGEFNRIKSGYGFISSDKILDHSELANISKDSLRLLRNEIFARKGYKFNSPDLHQYFQTKAWYKPQYNDVTDKISLIELVNIQMIKELEQK